MDEAIPLLLPTPRRVDLLDGTVRRGDLGSPRQSIDPAAVPHAQGYRMTISPAGAEIVAHDEAGIFYASQTLAQLPNEVPALRIEDWPDFPARGVMLDISRDKVPTMATLYALVDRLASWKVNQIQLYTEHTFAYPSHREVWAHASPMTADEIRALDAYCKERFIELVPNQNSFGHMERWLKYPRYADLAEAPEGFETPWGTWWDGPFSLNPTDPRSVELLRSIYDEVLPHFTSGMFNVGLDETFDLGKGRSKTACEQRGTTRVYLDFLHEVHKLVSARGRRMMFWGDIILHKPELIPELPKDVIAMEWGYEADHPFERDTKLFRDAGVPFYVCPGTSTWCSIAGRTENMLGNLRSAAEHGLANGAIGYLVTDWGDYGHLQYQPASYAGFAAGAAYAWCLASNGDLPVAAALDRFAFEDDAGVMGKLALDLGNVYTNLAREGNASKLFRILVKTVTRTDPIEGVTREQLDAAEAAVDQAMSKLDEAGMRIADSDLVRDEFRNAAAMLRHACRRGRWKLDGSSENPKALAEEMRGIIAEHQGLWLARNREGGLVDSSRRLGERAEEYEHAGAKDDSRR